MWDEIHSHVFVCDSMREIASVGIQRQLDVLVMYVFACVCAEMAMVGI